MNNDADNICLACGLCCDGTLIGFVEVTQEEVSRLQGIKEVENVNGNGFFLHPCDKYCDGCTIYADRPKKCDQFNCSLLKSVEQKELAFDSAVETVKEVKLQKAAIEEKLANLHFELKSPSFYFKMVELKKLLQKLDPEFLTRNHIDLISNIKQLDVLLLNRFGVTLD